MKAITVLFSILATVAASLCLCSCTDKAPEQKQSDDVIVIVIEDGETGTLIEHMSARKLSGEFSYEISGGMVTEINGKANNAAQKTYWMLYTDDEEYANGEWGSFEYNGKTYMSAVLGAEDLPVKGGYTYIWAYVKL